MERHRDTAVDENGDCVGCFEGQHMRCRGESKLVDGKSRDGNGKEDGIKKIMVTDGLGGLVGRDE